jgi:hypothetical protein
MSRKPLILAVLLAVLLMPAVSSAMGIGYFYATGTGDSITRIDGSPDAESSLHFNGNGLVLDTSVGRDETFNYRLALAAGRYGDKNRPYDALVMIHDFGFSPARNQRARLWLGPEVMLNFIDDKDSAESPKLFGFGMGLAVGANINITKRLSLMLKTALISQTLSGHMNLGGARTDLTTEDEFSYLSFGLVLRFNERF